MYSRIRLRKSNDEIERKSKEDEKGGYAYRKGNNDKHAMVFFFLGMAMNLNLDTSLLTERIFDVENFANITIFLYFTVVVIVCILYMFSIRPEFWQLVAGAWVLSFSRTCQVVLSVLAHGKSGRNLFLLFYSINGFLRGIISLTSTFVISMHFLNESYLHFINGAVFFSILASLLQIIAGVLIGDETLRQVRRTLVICQTVYLLETLIASVWITIVFIEYGLVEQRSGEKPGDEKYQQAIKKFTYIPYYISKFFVSFFACFFRVIFHPVLIPYMMDVSNLNKLLASIVFTLSEFLGRLVTFQVDEYIDPSKKSHTMSDNLFLFRQDLHLYLLFSYQCFVCTLAVYSSWFQKYGISSNPYFVTFITMTSGLVTGYNINRAASGSQAVLQYYSKSKGVTPQVQPAGSGITAEVASDTSNVNDIITLLSYSCFLVACLVSYYFQHAIVRRKDTLEFIILSHKRYMDKESVRLLATKLNL